MRRCFFLNETAFLFKWENSVEGKMGFLEGFRTKKYVQMGQTMKRIVYFCIYV